MGLLCSQGAEANIISDEMLEQMSGAGSKEMSAMTPIIGGLLGQVNTSSFDSKIFFDNF